MDRRRFLQGIGGAAAVATGYMVLSGRKSPDQTAVPDEPVTPWEPPDVSETVHSDGPGVGLQFDEIYNVVEDLGVDSSGETPCGSTLLEATGESTLLTFPPGRYLVEKPLLFRQIGDFGIRGLGSDHTETKFVHPTGYSDYFLNIRSGRNCLLDNFTLEQTDDRETNSGLAIIVDDGLLVRDVEVAGFSPSQAGGTYDSMLSVESEDGLGRVDRFVSKGGAEVGVYPDAWPGMIVTDRHRGTLQLVDCHLEECGSNGLYGGRSNGTVQIYGGLYKNCDIAQIRLSGENALIEDAEIVIDTADATNVEGTYEVIRGVWWEAGRRTNTGGEIRNTTFVDAGSPIQRGLLEVDGTTGGLTVENCTFRTDTDRFRAIYTRVPGESDMGGTPPKPWGLTLRNVDIEGDATRNAPVIIRGRPGTTIENVTVRAGGQNRDGIVLSASPETTITETSVEAGRYPIVVHTGNRQPADCRLELADSVTLRSPELDSPDEAAASESGGGSICLGDFAPDQPLLAVTQPDDGSFLSWALAEWPDDYTIF